MFRPYGCTQDAFLRCRDLLRHICACVLCLLLKLVVLRNQFFPASFHTARTFNTIVPFRRLLHAFECESVRAIGEEVEPTLDWIMHFANSCCHAWRQSVPLFMLCDCFVWFLHIQLNVLPCSSILLFYSMWTGDAVVYSSFICRGKSAILAQDSQEFDFWQHLAPACPYYL